MKDTISNEWNEISLLASFLAYHEGGLSEETRLLIKKRMEALMQAAESASSRPPDPY